MEYDKYKTCCFIGHRKINETDRLRADLYSKIEDLIINHAVCNFLFGSRSNFNDLCFEIVTELKEKYPYIIRVYVRAEFPYINDDYRAYLVEKYEDTYYPEHMVDAGRAAYVERNYEMIKNSDYCICYYDENYAPPRRRNSRRDLTDYQPKSGTKIAYEYALKNCGHVINVFE
ncbi:MAG: hypothetical protein E7389_04315 [Ruminococcaceae bacterium]|nr:hypothetical protein [Oscillospiraceae bacterium]